MVTLGLTVTPGDYGMYSVTPVDDAGEPLTALCGQLLQANIADSGLWDIQQVVSFANPTKTANNVYGVPSCPDFNKVIHEGDDKVHMRVKIRQLSLYIAAGDRIVDVYCGTKPLTADIETENEFSIVYEEFEAIRGGPDVTLQFVDAITYEPLVGPIYVGHQVRLLFTLKDEAGDKGAVAAWLHTCQASSSTNFVVDETVTVFDPNGCPLPLEPNKGLPFVPSEFLPYEVYPGYSLNAPIVFASVTNAFPAAAFDSNPSTIIYRCSVETCATSDETLCFQTKCGLRRKRQAGTKPNGNTTTVAGALVFEKLPFTVYYQNHPAQEPADTAIQTEACFDTWMFIVVVVILGLLLGLAVLVSSCLLFHMKRQTREQKSMTY
ncbi:hypothetical protein ScPMuIL_016773 [Solemya velum]